MNNKSTVLGLMSGSSLDGLDACLSAFSKENGNWSYEIVETNTFPLPDELKESLQSASKLNALDLLVLDKKLGTWISDQIAPMVERCDVISLHGHTVFHEPEQGISLQIGSGEVIATKLKATVVANFRNKDILLGGQGAPLVPKGEELLFSEFDSFLNLGGICNLTFRRAGQIIAGDVGPFNQVYNHYANKAGHTIDANGELSASGEIIPDILNTWNQNTFFTKPFPKSLSNQWVESNFFEFNEHHPRDVLHTFSHFITDQISTMINAHKPKRIMITGGGAYHQFALHLLKLKSQSEIVLPDKSLIDFKEALIFGLLGLLRVRGEENVLSSCTGASHDSSSGIIYQG